MIAYVIRSKKDPSKFLKLRTTLYCSEWRLVPCNGIEDCLIKWEGITSAESARAIAEDYARTHTRHKITDLEVLEVEVGARVLREVVTV